MEPTVSLDHLTIACIGLGRMGAGIARNLQASGCRSSFTTAPPLRWTLLWPLALWPRGQPVRPRQERISWSPRLWTTNPCSTRSWAKTASWPGYSPVLSTSAPAPSRRAAARAVPLCTSGTAATTSPLRSSAALMLPRLENCSLSSPASPRLLNVPGRCWLPTGKMLLRWAEDPAAAPSLKLAGNFFGASLL